MKRIIINADDFGINKIVTDEIERMILAGAISSTTVMANSTCLDEVRRFACEHPEISYGIHLCLSEFSSLTKSEGLKRIGLTDENGCFIHKAIFGLKDYANMSVQTAIREELNAQIDVASSLGFPISHADSHHHVHTIYPLKELFAEVLQKRGIKRIRKGGDFRTLRMRRHLFLWMQRRKLNEFYGSKFTTTDAFYTYAEYMNKGCNRKEGVVELMCHPGHLGKQYQNEMKYVEEKLIIDDQFIKLITYNDL